MKINITSLFISLLMLIPFHGFSSHIVGGEITYSYLGNNVYEIQLTIYRDCYNGIPPFDNPASFGIFDANNNIVDSFQIPLSPPDTITNSPYNCLPVAPPNICYEAGKYILTVTLPPIHGGYQVAYQRCCRTSALINIDQPQNTGATFYGTIPDSIYAANSSPVFKYFPFTFLCENVPFTFDNSATDADGDSLVYELFTPLTGGSASIPMPNPPANPPYSQVNWITPYSISNAMGGNPLTINPLTGLLSGTPNTAGVFDYGIGVKEFRSGIYIGETKRDFQVYVIASVGIKESTKEQYITCIQNKSENSVTFKIAETLFLENTKIIIYDMMGKEVRQFKNISTHEIKLNGNSVSGGVFFLILLMEGNYAAWVKLFLFNNNYKHYE